MSTRKTSDDCRVSASAKPCSSKKKSVAFRAIEVLDFFEQIKSEFSVDSPAQSWVDANRRPDGRFAEERALLQNHSNQRELA
jgi:hypothetical protein